MNRLPRFELEDFFRRFAFQPEMVNLSPSNPISPTIGEILELAGLPPTALQELSLDYSETAGAWTLRQAVAALYDDLEADQVMVTSGAVEAIALTLEALIEPGDRVVLESPIYGSYGPLLHLLGAEVTRYELAAADAYEYDFERLEEVVRASRSEFLVVNPYNNPTGRGLASASSLVALAELSSRTGCKVVCDEVFRHASLHGDSLPSVLDTAHDAIAIGDMTKAWGLGGLRIGWLACRDDTVLERALTTRDFTTNSNSIVSESLAELALSVRESLLDAALRNARSALSDLDRFIEDSKGALSWCPPVGGYCGWVEVHVESARSVPELCATLAEERNYLILPGVVFGSQWARFFRVGLAAGGEQLVAGLGAFLEEAAAG
ncbi:MAG: pyridoxal phosphate-dependent aminotransferase [Acidimicrobiales bacterium]